MFHIQAVVSRLRKLGLTSKMAIASFVVLKFFNPMNGSCKKFLKFVYTKNFTWVKVT